MEKIEFEFNERDRRCAVLQWLVNTNFEVTNVAISRALGISERTICDIRKALKETRDVSAVLERKTKAKEDARKTRDPDFIAKVQEMVDNDPTKSMRRMSEELNTSKWTINQCVMEDLRCRSYRMQTGQLLTEATVMADVAAPAVKKVVKAKKPKVPAAHPTYAVMVAAAIKGLKDRTGSSRQAILKYILANYKVDAAKAGVPLRLALKKGVAAGTLKMAKATGKGAGCFKLGEKADVKKPKKVVKKKPAAKKPKAKKVTKKPAAKKAAAKKPAAKKAAKKPAAKKPAAKKPAAKKPAAKKPAAKKPAAKKPATKKPAAKK